MTSHQSKAKQQYDKAYNARPEQVDNREKRNAARAALKSLVNNVHATTIQSAIKCCGIYNGFKHKLSNINSLTRQAFAWNAALFSKITNPKLLGKPIDDAALKKLGYVQEDFVTGKKSIREKRQTDKDIEGRWYCESTSLLTA